MPRDEYEESSESFSPPRSFSAPPRLRGCICAYPEMPQNIPKRPGFHALWQNEPTAASELHGGAKRTQTNPSKNPLGRSPAGFSTRFTRAPATKRTHCAPFERSSRTIVHDNLGKDARHGHRTDHDRQWNNRPHSNALKVARIVERHYAGTGAHTEMFSLEDLPPETFHGTAYANKPPAMKELQQRVLAARGLHVVTPEYNGSFPGVLKMFIDMLKFPESFDRKPVAFVGESAGLWGGLRPVEQLQMIFSYRNAYAYPDRVFIPGINQKLDHDGRLTDPAIDERLAKQAAGFAAFASAFV